MSRDIEPSERLEPTRVPHDSQATHREVEMPPPSREQSLFRGRTYAYSLSADELETMYDIGRFRVIATEDLALQRYAGRDAEMRQDLRSLLSQGLVPRRKLYVGVKKEELTVLALTKAGKKILHKVRENEDGQACRTGRRFTPGSSRPERCDTTLRFTGCSELKPGGFTRPADAFGGLFWTTN